ncbi:MAG: glycosyltransferase [Nitrospira sp.]|nr:glycosyltransferase [Nitrospira sp.]MDH4368987.1 glycosyltransferase [Nitrospira sp.]MDH5496536.1 glycosyltransferase [Nitrospira sp.]
MKSLAIRSRWFSRPLIKNLEGIDVLVIVKSLTEEDVFLAEQAAERGVPVILDLCDNIFVPGYLGRGQVSPADNFMAMVKHATAIVASTETLAAEITRSIGEHPRVFVVPDGLMPLGQECGNRSFRWEKFCERSRRVVAGLRPGRVVHKVAQLLPGPLGKSLMHQEARRQIKTSLIKFVYKRLNRLSQRNRAVERPHEMPLPKVTALGALPAKRILWFGNHGAPYSNFGMLELLTIRDVLERIAVEMPVELWVVSNNRTKYNSEIAPLAIPSHYVEWSPHAMKTAFSLADVVVLPSTCDPFSICKSANRAVLALSNKVPVVATGTPALAPLSDCIETNDFYTGIKRYLTESDHVRSHLRLAANFIEANFGKEVITAKWMEVLSYARKQVVSVPANDFQIIVCLHLVQDLDLALPVLAQLLRKGIRFQVWLSTSLRQKSLRVGEALQQMGCEWQVLPDSYPESHSFHFPASVKAVLAVAETNLGPHRFTHEILRRANRAGVVTFCMQHGFENVGLTYTDDVHAIEKVTFAAKHIFVWGSLDALHPQCASQTVSRCISVGCPKPAWQPPAPELDDLLPRNRKIIGVFENLHWHRYSAGYREFFLESIRGLADEFPEYVFLIKPHHAGMWLTSRYKGERPHGANIVIANPDKAPWERFTAGQLLGRLDGVITTPSTVALDAARANVPVTVIGYDLDVSYYAPLTVVSTIDQLREFVQSINEKLDSADLIKLSRLFVERRVLNGDAAQRIVADLVRTIDLQEVN